MSRARHMKENLKDKAPKAYSAKDSDVEMEAEEKKHGGRVKKHEKETKAEGHKGKKRLDKKARGGKCYASGGRVGSDKNPFSSAASPKPKGEPSAKA